MRAQLVDRDALVLFDLAEELADTAGRKPSNTTHRESTIFRQIERDTTVPLPNREIPPSDEIRLVVVGQLQLLPSEERPHGATVHDHELVGAEAVHVRPSLIGRAGRVRERRDRRVGGVEPPEVLDVPEALDVLVADLVDLDGVVPHAADGAQIGVHRAERTVEPALEVLLVRELQVVLIDYLGVGLLEGRINGVVGRGPDDHVGQALEHRQVGPAALLFIIVEPGLDPLAGEVDPELFAVHEDELVVGDVERLGPDLVVDFLRDQEVTDLGVLLVPAVVEAGPRVGVAAEAVMVRIGLAFLADAEHAQTGGGDGRERERHEREHQSREQGATQHGDLLGHKGRVWGHQQPLN